MTRTKAPARDRSPADRPLWRCPRCGRPFANRKQEHSCVRVSVASHLRGRPARVVTLYRRFEELVRGCGPVILAPASTRIGFQVRMIFAAVTLTNSGLRGHVVLARRHGHPRFTNVETISARNHVHHFRIERLEELDGTVEGWLREAYRVGQQEHLGR